MGEGRDLMEELRGAVAEAEALLEGTAGEAGEDVVRQVHDKVTEALERARATLEDLEDDVSRYIRDNPWQSLGVAAVIGLAIGVLVAGRRKRDD
jgi:ElaB/YqjD/DUF883 family membrane-anchored ribosome-binding protein